MTEHTKLPWHAANVHIFSPKNELIASIHGSRANQEFIVRACNSHDELLAACRAALSQLKDAIKKAEGE